MTLLTAIPYASIPTGKLMNRKQNLCLVRPKKNYNYIIVLSYSENDNIIKEIVIITIKL